MKADAQIAAWLKSARPDYTEGLNLLESYSNKPALLAQLKQYKNVEMLKKSLQTLLSKKATAVSVTKTTKPRSVSSSASSSTDTKEDFRQQRIQLAKEIDALKSRLYFIGRNTLTEEPYELSEAKRKERLQIAAQLVGDGGLHERFRKNLEDYVHYEQTGKLPEPEQEEEPIAITSGADVYLAKENCRKNVTRLKRKIEEGQDEADALRGTARKQLKAKIAEWESKLKRESKRLKQLEKQILYGRKK